MSTTQKETLTTPNLNATAIAESPHAGIPKNRYEESEVLDAIKQSNGTMKNVAKKLAAIDNSACGWHTAKRAVNAYPATLEAFQNAREALIDDAERCVHKAIKRGDVQASTYILNTVGKDRGYSTKTEVVNTGQTIHIHISADEDDV